MQERMRENLSVSLGVVAHSDVRVGCCCSWYVAVMYVCVRMCVSCMCVCVCVGVDTD